MTRRLLIVALACLASALAAAPVASADVVDDAPAAAARGVGDLRVFIRGNDNALWTRTWDGSSWSNWSSLGGTLTSGPAASARPDGIYDVVVRGTDGAFYHRAFTPADGWTPFTSIGGGFSSAPAVTYRKGTGNIDVAGTGTDGQLWFKSYTPGSGWSAWVPMGGSVRGAPTITSPASGALDIYLRGSDDQLYQQAWSGSAWSGFIPRGGALSAGPAVVSWNADRRDIFVRGVDNAIYLKTWAGDFFPYAGLGGIATSGPGAVTEGPGRLRVFVRDAAGGISTNAYNGSWSGWQSFGPVPPIAPSAPPAPPPPPDLGTLDLNSGLGCVPQGSRLPVRIKIKQRPGRARPRVSKVRFYVGGGRPARTDHRAPYTVRLRVTFRPGTKHRVFARVYYRRTGTERLRTRTVSRRFVMCR